MKKCLKWMWDNKMQTITGVILVIVFSLLVAWPYFQKEEEEVYIFHMVSGNRIYQEGEEAPYLNLYARAAAVYDVTGGRLLYGKNEEVSYAMASTTKIMTCILALESGRLDEWATVSSYAASQPRVHAGLRSGEEYLVRDLLYSLMLESHNDTAVVIAEHIGGSVEGFADMMNAKARELGLTETYFITPNGLDATDENGTHSTTAEELTILGAYALQNPEFIEITNTGYYSFASRDNAHNIQVSNANAFLGLMEGAIGIKTGYTNDAGYCFAGAVQWGDRQFVSAVLGSGWPPNRSYKWSDTTELFEYVRENYEERTITVPEMYVPAETIEGEVVSYIWSQALELDCFLSDYDEIELEAFYPSSIEGGNLLDGEVIGWRRIILNDEEIARVSVYYRRISGSDSGQE